ncbi:hypothetical protein MC885_010309, partial [Smutsia gigantea]
IRIWVRPRSLAVVGVRQEHEDVPCSSVISLTGMCGYAKEGATLWTGGSGFMKEMTSVCALKGRKNREGRGRHGILVSKSAENAGPGQSRPPPSVAAPSSVLPPQGAAAIVFPCSWTQSCCLLESWQLPEKAEQALWPLSEGPRCFTSRLRRRDEAGGRCLSRQRQKRPLSLALRLQFPAVATGLQEGCSLLGESSLDRILFKIFPQVQSELFENSRKPKGHEKVSGTQWYGPAQTLRELNDTPRCNNSKCGCSSE